MSTEKNSDLFQPERPTHRDIVELATQLVTAQIQANAQYESSIQVMSMVKQLVKDASELLIDLQSSKPENREAPLSDLRRMMSQHQLLPSMPKELKHLTHPDLDQLFQAAMSRAFEMLNAPFDSERVVYAEQIFKESEILTEGAIRARFIKYKWPDLSSGGPVTKLMKDVNKWFTAHIKNLNLNYKEDNAITSTDPKIPIAVRIESQIAELSWLLKQVSESSNLEAENLPAYTQLRSELSQFHNHRNGLDIAGVFRKLDAGERNNLIFLIFGGQGPKAPKTVLPKDEQSTGSEVFKGDQTPQKKYYAWALFRYLRLYVKETEDLDGQSLTKRLRAPRSQLASTSIPDVSYLEPSDYRFGFLHDLTQDLLDATEIYEEDN